MLRRLFALIVLVGIVGAAWYVWASRSGASVPGEARATGTFADATEKLGRVGSEIQDARITASVKTALTLNRNLEPYSLDVDSDDGVVTLGGQISRDDLKQMALQIAAAVPGVARVNDQLRVDTASAAAPGDGRTVGEALDDRALQAKVNLAFSLNRNLHGTDIDVQAFRRAVTLTGEAARPEQRQLAVAIAQQTPNVLGVTDQIRVAGQPSSGEGTSPAASTTAVPAATASGDAAASVEKAIASNANLGSYGLEARVERDRVVLSGRVRTEAEKDLAGVLAREASGLPVDNAVEVRP